ncbi:helix-turn-helix domain-containing protein [Virgibacillus proomii]|uniref:helix-turn-helix domain-containing protein n=1 Tax=Virgibacillus proomii TaxID=84407 RepID=UPI0028156004|nr:helix-turn-helix transcriptional regulator [Virgibacillus proomii]
MLEKIISYKPLRHLLVDMDINITSLCRDLKISSTIRTKLTSDLPVSLRTIAKICRYLDVPIEDVVEVIRD